MNGTISTAAAAAAAGVPTRQRRRRINNNNGSNNNLNVPLASPTCQQRQQQHDNDDDDDDHHDHDDDQKQQHHQGRFMMIPSSILPLIVRRRQKQQGGQQQQQRRRRRIRDYPPGSYDARIQQHREIIFFCVIFTILALILFHLISILLYMNASSFESLIRGIDINFNDNGPILIIGGTDGSGTRAFVDTLKELNCVIVYDDPITFDIHASELFKKRGWPAFVTEVLHQTHSANYNYDVDLPDDIKFVLEKEMKKFQHSLEPKYNYSKRLHKEHIQKLHRNEIFNRLFNFQGQHSYDNNNNNNEHHLASKISFVMKAPVSMLVLPVISKLFDRKIKFLHVVRDGRDIALSDNQSPVVKFYDTMYENDDDHQTQQQLERYKTTKPDNILNIRAMQLWNDWNIQVQQYLKSKSASSNNIEYLTIRSEDLLQKETRYDALLALKEFVGSHLSQQELCCIAYEQTKDYGHSAVHIEKNGRPDMSMPDEPKDLLKPYVVGHHQKRNVNPSSEMMKRLNTHGNELNQPLQQQQYPPRRRRLQQMVMDEEAADNNNNGMEERKQTFMKDLKEYKQVVLHQGKAMSMEQLEEWIDRGEQLKLSLQEIQSSSYGFEDVNDHYTLELQDYVDTLQTYYKRKENLEALHNNLNRNDDGQKIPIPIIPIQRQQQNPKIKNVKKRYGKWQQILANQPQLLEILQQEGKEALEYFGYEPYRTITYYNNRTHNNDQQQQQPLFGRHDADTTASSENGGGTNTLKEQEEGSFVCTKEVALEICGRYDY